MSKEKQLIKDAFEANPNVKSFFATSDGQCFENKDNALDHANSLKDKGVAEFERSAIMKAKAAKSEKSANDGGDSPKKTPMQIAKERVAEINKAATVAEVEALTKDQTAKSVIAAGENRIAELAALPE